ncbi:MAG: hypothetical protein KDD82_23355 [Planctomycetes bacterium]|nr:hypothetical protein [Planctomycetota bacterium]
MAACSAPEPAPPPPRYEPVLGRSEVRALGDYLYAGYALRAAQEGLLPNPDVGALEEDLARARGDLREALVRAGADPARAQDEANLLPIAHEAAQRGDRYAFLFTEDGRSFSVVRLRARKRRERAFFGQAFPYTVLEFDETLVDDYPSHLTERRAARPASYSSAGPTVRLDYAAIVEIGQRQFLPQAPSLVAAIQATEADFLEFAQPERTLELLGLTKTVLRGRSVEALWSRLAPRPAAERLQGFVQDYAAHSELRAAAELYALLAEPSEGPPDPVALAQRGALAAMLHDEPLGHLADLVGLAILGVQQRSDLPPLVAARQLLFELLAELRQGPPSPEADARACAALAHLPAKEIRELALHAWNSRTK